MSRKRIKPKKQQQSRLPRSHSRRQITFPGDEWFNMLFAFGCACVLPFVIINENIEPVILPRAIVLAFLTIAATIYIVAQQFRQPGFVDASIFKRIFFPTFLFLFLWSVLSLSQSPNLTETSFALFLLFLKLCFAVVFVILLMKSPNLFHYLSRLFSITVVILAYIGITQYFGTVYKSLPGNFVVYGTMANKNQFAEALVLMLPFVLNGIINRKGWWSLVSMAALAMSVFAIGISYSRTAWLATAAGLAAMILAGVLALRSKNISESVQAFYRKRIFYIIPIALVSILFAVSAHVLRTTTTQSLSRALTASHVAATPGSSLAERFKLWERTIPMVADHPLTGVGAGCWKLVFPKYGTEGLRSQYGNLQFVRPHNDFLWILAETGIPAFIAFLLMFILLYYYAARAISRGSDERVKMLMMLLAFGMTAYVVISSASFPIERMTHSMLLMMMSGAIVVIYHREFPVQPRALSRHITLVAGVLIVAFCATCVYASYSRIVSEIHIKRGIYWQNQRNWEAAYREYTAADNFWMNIDPAVTPVALYSGQALMKMERFSQSLPFFQRAVDIHPYHMVALTNLAATYDRLGQYDQAEKLFHQVLAISPGIEHTSLNLAAIYIKQERYDAADSLLGSVEAHFKLTDAGMAKLGDGGVADSTRAKLAPILNRPFLPEREFLDFLQGALFRHEYETHRQIIIESTGLNLRVLRLRNQLQIARKGSELFRRD